jgi:hypothetical protein
VISAMSELTTHWPLTLDPAIPPDGRVGRSVFRDRVVSDHNCALRHASLIRYEPVLGPTTGGQELEIADRSEGAPDQGPRCLAANDLWRRATVRALVASNDGRDAGPPVRSCRHPRRTVDVLIPRPAGP